MRLKVHPGGGFLLYIPDYQSQAGAAGKRTESRKDAAFPSGPLQFFAAVHKIRMRQMRPYPFFYI